MIPTCPYCNNEARLVTGKEIYPHRPDLYTHRIWQCGPCDAYVGCHRIGARVKLGGNWVESDGTLPLGRLADRRLRDAKMAAHRAFDPLWQYSRESNPRTKAYAWLADELGMKVMDCHIGNFDIETCNKVVSLCLNKRRSHHVKS